MAGDTDCAGSLTVTRAATGSMYDGTQPGSKRVGSCVGKTGKASTWTAAQKTSVRKYFEVQRAVYEESASGWMYWNYSES